MEGVEKKRMPEAQGMKKPRIGSNFSHIMKVKCIQVMVVEKQELYRS